MSPKEEIVFMQKAMRESDNTRLFERYMAIRLHLEGRSFTEIAHILGRTYQTISTYWKDYQENGLAGLDLDHAPGGPKKLSLEQEQQVVDTISGKRPVDDGFAARYTWTLQIMVTWIEREFGQRYTPRGVSKLLKRLGFSYTKATYTLAKADPAAQAIVHRQSLSNRHRLLQSDRNFTQNE